MVIWREYRLNEVIEKFIDYRGKTPKKIDSGIPLITAKIIKNGRILNPTEFISEQDYHKWMTRGFPKKNDVIITTEAPLGEIALLQNDGVALAQRVILLRGKKNILDNIFLNYLMQSNLMQHRIHARGSGSTVKGIKASELKKVKIPLPPIDDQIKISKILYTLDQKIDLLRRQNETLEHIAQTLFKHWFVDFEFPDEHGQPYNRSGGEMVPSELGEIPKGWKVGYLYDLITVNPTETLKKGKLAPYVEMKSLSTAGMTIKNWWERPFVSGSKFRNGDTLLARITPCLENGKTSYVNILGTDQVGWGSTEFIVLRANNSFLKEYTYCLSRDLTFRNNAIKNMTGSSGRKRVPTDIVKNYSLVLPDTTILKQFSKLAFLLFKKIENNQSELNTLAMIRDILLPRLMSGQIRVKH